MKKSVLKVVLALCTVYVCGSVNVSDSWTTQSVTGSKEVLRADINPIFKPTDPPDEESAQKTKNVFWKFFWRLFYQADEMTA